MHFPANFSTSDKCAIALARLDNSTFDGWRFPIILERCFSQRGSGKVLSSARSQRPFTSSSRLRSYPNPEVVYARSMAQSAEKILKQALLLPDKERAEVIAELLDSLPPSDAADSRSDEEWIAEVERRARAALAGSAGVSWEQARMELTRRLQPK